ncbi:MAG: hypothetical protein FWD53_12255 [Phycisphaerales bacterium]|nr:hypothetical protein [Phycisphaerales bacterium]
MTKLSVCVCLCLSVASLALAAPPATPALLTMGEIRSLVEGGRYKDALSPISRALALQGPAAAAYDRHELFMLRAECQLQNKDQTNAIAALNHAKKEAITARQFGKLAAPTALAALVQKSVGYKYTPKNAKEGFSVLDLSQRPAAYAALLADEFPQAKSKVDALNHAKTMAPILEAAKLVGTLRALEIVTKSDPPQTAPLVAAVTTHTDRLTTAAIDSFAKQSTDIRNNAQQIVRDTVGVYDQSSQQSWLQPRTRRRGVTNQEAATLRSIMADCDKIRASAAEIATALATDFETYQAIATKADAMKAKAAVVLNDDYSVVP